MVRRTGHTETRALGAFALVCYSATLAGLLAVVYALVTLGPKAAELRQLVASAGGGF